MRTCNDTAGQRRAESLIPDQHDGDAGQLRISLCKSVRERDCFVTGKLEELERLRRGCRLIRHEGKSL